MKRRTYVLWKRRLLRFTLAALMGAALFVYSRTGLFTIHTYEFVGVPEEYKEDLETQAGYAAERKLLYILPGNRVLSYHDDDIRAAIMDTLPNTKDITIYPRGLHTLRIKLAFYTPMFAVSDTHAISSEGVVYKEVMPLSSFPLLEVASSTKVSGEMLQAMATLVSNIDSVLFPIRFISIDEYDDIRFYDEMKRSSIIVSDRSNLDTAWSNILSAIDTDPLKSKLLDTKERLEYLDARFGNKVFYKFTNSSTPVIIPPHEATDTATTTVEQ